MIVQASEPISVVIEGSTGWASPSTLAPLIVSLVALGGVVFNTWFTSRRMEERDKEQRKAVVDAENHRHENDLNRAGREHMLDVTRDAYVELEGARYELTGEAARLRFIRDSETAERDGTWGPHNPARAPFNAALRRFNNAQATVSLLGSNTVLLAAEPFGSVAGALEWFTPGGEPFVQEFSEVTRLSDELHEAMRNELHG